MLARSVIACCRHMAAQMRSAFAVSALADVAEHDEDTQARDSA